MPRDSGARGASSQPTGESLALRPALSDAPLLENFPVELQVDHRKCSGQNRPGKIILSLSAPGWQSAQMLAKVYSHLMR